ncbi:hypothetical protein SAMN05421790_11033 [Kroppenstedtia eburnea]|uniref:Uncharacterized protein n=1 Tax=Kroppenstedtia eburnea TaxID=714067 RepID=A0A1N7NT75_9BACL|nr:hypothetical protein SAMN05421790_11033 [Kroppenstedtia eburnea]
MDDFARKNNRNAAQPQIWIYQTHPSYERSLHARGLFLLATDLDGISIDGLLNELYIK